MCVMIKNNTCGNRDAQTKRPGVKKTKEKKSQERINKVGHEESFVPIKWNRVWYHIVRVRVCARARARVDVCVRAWSVFVRVCMCVCKRVCIFI